MARNDRAYLQDIARSARRIMLFTNGLNADKFAANPLVQDAVSKNLELIGEYVGKLSESVKALRPDVPWRDIIGLRTVLAHTYWRADFDIVWKIVVKDVPAILEVAEDLLEDLS